MRTFGLALLSVCLLESVSLAAPVIYTGHTISFSKAPHADPLLPENQDRILDDIIISRGSSQGIFNIAQEDVFTSNLSPVGTAWAFKSNNPGQTLAAANWAALNFTNWQTALGGTGSLATNILDGDAVLHLIDHDIYLDIRFTAWGAGSPAGGSFAYERAALVPEPSGLLLAILLALGFCASSRR